MNQYKIVQVPPDSHVGKKKPELNILQKKMHFEAVAISEAEMRLIMERKEAEEIHHEMHGHGGYDIGSVGSLSARPIQPYWARFTRIRWEVIGFTPIAIDPIYPVLQPPDTYVSSSLLGNSFTIMNPVSTFGATTVCSKTLTGTYVKTGDAFNNRDVFQNNQNHFVLYNSAQNLWTLVGPGSSSTTVWLSADAGVGDWGNPPNVGWRGIAFSNGSTSSFGGGIWVQPTRIQTTQTLAHSGTFSYPYWGNLSNLMNLYDPASGINSNFRWKHLDFTGRVYPNTNPYQSVQGRGTMISPVHFTYAIHYSPWLRSYDPANNDVCKIYDANGNATSVTVLSSIELGNDMGVAILSQPVNATQYFVLSGNYNYIKMLSASDSFNNYLVGPTQSGTVGVGLPQTSSSSSITITFKTNMTDSGNLNNYSKIYSVPHSEWHGGTAITGDSSSQMWVISGNKLILAGHTTNGGTSVSGPYYGYWFNNSNSQGYSLITAITALNQRYYGNAFAYSLTAVNF
jgi:hypothetical protein